MKIMNVSDSRNIRFGGYKNIISNNISSENRQLMFMAMQLNDSDKKDLLELTKLSRMSDEFSNSFNTGVFDCFYLNKANEGDMFFINGRPIATGEVLKELVNLMPYEDYKKEENISMKAFTLLASITKRIMYNNLYTTDSGIKSVFKGAHEDLTNIISNSKVALDIIQRGCLKNEKPDIISSNLNKFITRTMGIFFK